jgi:Protein of unknown function (DUF2442)
MVQIVKATYSGDFIIDFSFNDGHQNRVDFGPFLAASPNEMVKIFRDITAFQAFRIGSGNQSIVWGNDQAMSFGIDSIYDRNPVYVPVNPFLSEKYLAYLDRA